MLIDNIHTVTVLRKTIRDYYNSINIPIIDYKVTVLSSQLSLGSGVRIEYLCDICNKKYSTAYTNYILQKRKRDMDTCYKCSTSKINIQYRLKQEDVIKRLKEIHGEKYSYEKLEYINCNTKVIVTCSKHGDFLASPDNLLYNKSGCPICKESKGEILIANYLNDNNINYIRQYCFKDLKYRLPLRVDFYLPERNIVIEFDGEQHYNYKPKFHKTFCEYVNMRMRDKIKNNYCEENNIKLYRFRDIKNFTKIEKELNKILL